MGTNRRFCFTLGKLSDLHKEFQADSVHVGRRMSRMAMGKKRQSALMMGAAAIALIIGSSGPVGAADYRAGDYQAANSRFNWDGYYFGGHFGVGGFNIFDVSNDVGDVIDPIGAVGGLQLGRNWQYENIVWGIEGDFSVSGANGRTSEHVASAHALASVRGRLGLALDPVLVYGTAGLGVVLGRTYTSSGEEPTNDHRTVTPVVGGGVEYAINHNLTVRGEALAYLGDEQNWLFGGNDDSKFSHAWAARLGINYMYGRMESDAGADYAGYPFDWSGSYVGAHIGPGGASLFDSTVSETVTMVGAVAGLHFGRNWQQDNIVWSVEADISAAGLDKQADIPFTTTNTHSVDVLSSVRGRAGLAHGKTMVYGTAGVGLAHGNFHSQEPDPVASDANTIITPVVGFGIEHSVYGDITVRAEALGYPGLDQAWSNSTVGSGSSFDHAWAARFGVNYHWN